VTPGTTVEGTREKVGQVPDEKVPTTEPAVSAADPTDAGAGEFGAPRFVGRVALIVVAAVALGLFVEITLLSGLENRASQSRQFAQFRKALALGTAPVSQVDSSGRLLAFGTPVALLEIPRIHMHQVVGEGTTSEVLTKGPGHRRDTPLPGQAGTSIVMGRQAAFGGPFKHIHDLRRGDTITVVTGLGTSTFNVIDVRHAGDPIPSPLPSGAGRLTLLTADGTSFAPRGLLLVDANLTSRTLASAASVLSQSALQPSERADAGDTSTLWALVLWLEALVLVAAGIVWSWQQWGHYQTWIVFFPLTAVVSYFVADQVVRLLPNIL
jgi:LPXTG-site transpeptidase (sortase) family protein